MHQLKLISDYLNVEMDCNFIFLHEYTIKGKSVFFSSRKFVIVKISGASVKHKSEAFCQKSVKS